MKGGRSVVDPTTPDTPFFLQHHAARLFRIASNPVGGHNLNSGLYCPQRLPDAEAFYQDRFEVLESAEKRNHLNSREWSMKAKKEKLNISTFAGSARLARTL